MRRIAVRFRCPRRCRPTEQVGNHRLLFILAQIRKRRHEPPAAIDDLLNLFSRKPGSYANERWSAVVTASVDAMTTRADRSIHILARSRPARPWNNARHFAHRRNPGDVAAIYVDDTLLWIDSSATPFATAIESGKHNGSLTARRSEERVVPQSSKALQCSCMRAR